MKKFILPMVLVSSMGFTTEVQTTKVQPTAVVEEVAIVKEAPQASAAKKFNKIAKLVIAKAIVMDDRILEEGTELTLNEDLDLTEKLNVKLKVSAMAKETRWSEAPSKLSLILAAKTDQDPRTQEEVTVDVNGELSLETNTIAFYKFISTIIIEDIDEDQTTWDENERKAHAVLTNIIEKVSTLEELYIQLEILEQMAREEMKNDGDNGVDFEADFSYDKEKNMITLKITPKNEDWSTDYGAKANVVEFVFNITEQNTNAVIDVDVIANAMAVRKLQDILLDKMPLIDGFLDNYGKSPEVTMMVDGFILGYLELITDIIFED